MTTSPPPQPNNDVSTTTTDGPVMSFMNKRLRALKKKYNKILQIEEASSQGKPINKDQEEVLKTKPSILTLIDEYEKLRQPLYTVVQEEVFLNNKPKEEKQDDVVVEKKVEDLLKLLYFSCLFDVKQQSDFTSTMLTRTHERGCCLTYDYVTDDDGLLLGEKDLDMISLLGGLVVSRPVNSSLSHKNALRSCVEHAKLWLENSDKAIDDAGEITYKGLRERLEKILASDYFTTSPEMKAAVEVAAAAGKYAPSNVAVQGSSVSSEVSVQTESDFVQYEQKDEETENFEGQETGAEQSIPVEELSKDESEMVNAVENISDHKPEADEEGQNTRDMETKDHQYGQRRDYHNQRGGYRGGGGGGGRRGYPNGRGGGRGSRGGGYQNGRNQHYDQPGGYYPRNYYNARGRGGRGPRGNAFNNHGSAQGGHAPADEGGS